MNYFNPDESAAKIREELVCSVDEANGLAWNEGKRLLRACGIALPSVDTTFRRRRFGNGGTRPDAT